MKQRKNILEDVNNITLNNLNNYYLLYLMEDNFKVHTILFYIKHGMLESLKYFESRNIELNLERYLIAACQYGNLEIVKYFIELGTTYCTSKILKKCIKFKQYDILKYIIILLEHTIESDVYMYCINQGNLEMFKILFNILYLDTENLFGIRYTRGLLINSLIQCIRFKRQEILEYLVTFLSLPIINDTVITYCIRKKNIEALKFLIQKYPNYSDLNSLMYIACNNNCIEIVNSIIYKVNYIKYSCFVVSITKGYTEIINKLLSRYTYYCEGLFRHALNNSRNIEIIKLFIPKLSEENIYNIFSYYTNCYNIEILHLLLNLGLKPNKKNILECKIPYVIKLFILKGITMPEEILIKNCTEGNIDIVKLLLNLNFTINDKVLKATIQGGNSCILQELICRGANITIEDNYLVKYACLEGHLELVKILVENGANLTAENSICIQYACLTGHLEIVKHLVSQGLVLTDQLFEVSLKSGNLDLLIYFIENGICTKDFNDLLILATKNLSLKFIKFLVELGANINTHSGAPLILSVKAKNLEITRYLISKGASAITLYNSALLWAVQSGSLELTKLLIENGADPKDYNKHTPIILAVNNEYWNIVDYLINNHYDGLDNFIETFEDTEIVNKVKKQYKYDVIYKGPITDTTEKECGICLQEMYSNNEFFPLLQCLVCKKCVHKQCGDKWNKNCIYCRN
jgi:ankyrin repeat protein